MVKNNAKKGTKTYNLIEAYNTVLNGETIKVNDVTIWLIYPEREKRYYIHWQHYGSSAVKTNINEFRWLLRVIAKSKDYSFEVL